MTDDQITILAIKGAIAELPTEQAQKCAELATTIREMIVTHGEAAIYAIALIGAELQASE